MPREAARAATELDTGGTVVIVSGGGWGLGNLRGATDAALKCAPSTRVVTICGRNERLRSQLEQVWADDSRVRVLGFTEQMPELLAGADVLIHTIGGTTALEARLVGCRLINYGHAAAHVRAHHPRAEPERTGRICPRPPRPGRSAEAYAHGPAVRSA